MHQSTKSIMLVKSFLISSEQSSASFDVDHWERVCKSLTIRLCPNEMHAKNLRSSTFVFDTVPIHKKRSSLIQILLRATCQYKALSTPYQLSCLFKWISFSVSCSNATHSDECGKRSFERLNFKHESADWVAIQILNFRMIWMISFPEAKRQKRPRWTDW